jgi:RND family efflux transporter MFP subunit
MNYETTVDASTGSAFVGGDPLAEVEAEERADRKRWGLIAAAAVVVLAIVLFLVTRGGGSDLPADDKDQAPAITVVIPGRTTIEGTITATGSLAARREMPIGVVGDGGRVVSVPVDAGQWVRAGQILAVIDRAVQTQQALSSKANIDVAKADAELAQANLDRSLKLVDRGFISKADIDRLTATRDAAAARVKVAQAQYNELLARNARLNIVAPAAGLVLSRNVEPGQVVSPGAGALFDIAKDGQMEMLALLGEEDLRKVAIGKTASVVPVGTEQSYTGQIWQVSPTIDAQTRQGTARIALSWQPGLRPGGFATATINSGTVVAPLLPESAIQNDEQGSFVYVVGPDDKAQRRAIKTGLVTEKGIVITQGLSGNEKVVERAGGFLAPGDKIRPKLAASPK